MAPRSPWLRLPAPGAKRSDGSIRAQRFGLTGMWAKHPVLIIQRVPFAEPRLLLA